MSRKTTGKARSPGSSVRASNPSYRQMLLDAIGQFICWSRLPQVKGRHIRWSTSLLLTVALLMVWDGALALKDRFHNARVAARIMFPKLRAPGKTYQGFIKALELMHERLFDALCLMLQSAVMEVAAPYWKCGRWAVFAVDGSRVECPMTADNERALGCAGKAKTTPQQFLTVLLHLGSGLPWAFRRAGARGSERDHLLEMLPQLPPESMLVADAGFTGYELLTALTHQGHPFLIRVGSNVRLLRKLGFDMEETASTVYLWPKEQREHKPLVLRLITLVDGRNWRMHLLSSVREPQGLSDAEAMELYRRRWGVELYYRALKQTLARRKMRSGAAECGNGTGLGGGRAVDAGTDEPAGDHRRRGKSAQLERGREPAGGSADDERAQEPGASPAAAAAVGRGVAGRLRASRGQEGTAFPPQEEGGPSRQPKTPGRHRVGSPTGHGTTDQQHGSLVHLPAGFYQLTHVMVLLACMALCRIRTAEQLRNQPPGELGKLLGLDRIPEVRTLREKLGLLSQDSAALAAWSEALAEHWMAGDVEAAGVLYVDGHVRVYHGELAVLPKRYVSRQRLCLRGTTDYWVNDLIGQPYFVVSREFNEGLGQVLREEIVPRLLEEVPGQPTAEELAADPWRHRFIVIFDREASNPGFFQEMFQKHRVACISYRKQPLEAWEESEFQECQVKMPGGQTLSMSLAERGTRLSNGLWVQEVRKLSSSGQQVSLMSTAYRLSMSQAAVYLFSRWSQENFIKYMMEHYAIDALVEHGAEEADATREVVNPAWKQEDAQVRSLRQQLQRRQAEYAAGELDDRLRTVDVQRYQQAQTELREQIGGLEEQLAGAKKRRREVPKRIAMSELPAEQRIKRLLPGASS